MFVRICVAFVCVGVFAAVRVCVFLLLFVCLLGRTCLSVFVNLSMGLWMRMPVCIGCVC